MKTRKVLLEVEYADEFYRDPQELVDELTDYMPALLVRSVKVRPWKESGPFMRELPDRR